MYAICDSYAAARAIQDRFLSRVTAETATGPIEPDHAADLLRQWKTNQDRIMAAVATNGGK